MTITLMRAFAGIAAATLIACSRAPEGEGEAKADTSKKEAGMPDMPGMPAAAVATLNLSAAQVAHGKIEWGAVTAGSTSGTATIPGQIVADEDRTARLGAPARGRVLSVQVSPGDRVVAGQALAIVQSADASVAQSDIAKSVAAVTSRRAQAQYAKTAKERAERLLAIKAIPRQDYEKAVADDELAQSELRQSEAELRRARDFGEQIGADSAASGNIVLRSPLAGVVLTRAALPGTVVDAGALLLVVTDPSRLWLAVNAPEQFTGLVHAGGQLRFLVPAYADTFTARITAVGAGLDADTRTLPVRASLDSRGNRLKPGMLATVVVVGTDRVTAPLVPEDAIQSMQGKPTVFLAQPDGKGGVQVTPREVEVGSRANGRVAVLRGLAAGDVIVLSGAFAVKSELQKASMPKMEM